MTTTPTIPTIECKLEMRNGSRVLIGTCPECNETLVHGGCKHAGDGDGHRLSHCGCHPLGYYITEIQATTTTSSTTTNRR